MIKKVEGSCKAIAGTNVDGVYIGGSEYCVPNRMEEVRGTASVCGFIFVTSHSGASTRLGDGTNVLAMHNTAMSNIVNELPLPKSIIVVDLALSGCQFDNKFTESIRNGNRAGLRETTYRDSEGALIVTPRNTVIGFYHTAKNLLVTSDITHRVNGPTELIKLLTELLKYKAHYKIGGACKKGVRYTKARMYSKIDKNIMIGLDPEMGILNKVGKFVGSPYTGREIGRDAGDVVELRPKPGTVKQVINNVRELYKHMDKTLGKDLRLVSGGGSIVGRALGGHIHFNIPSNRHLITLLDDFVGKPIQRINGSARGNGSSYGGLSSFNTKPHGFEYRTPPSFIGKPDLFAGVIAVAYCVASTWKTICNSGSTFEYGCGEVTGAYAKSYEKLTCHSRYKKDIDAFLEYVNNEEKSIEETDVLAAWEIRDAIQLEDISI